ncbi:sensor histidine kinase [Micromonospora echinofusca]|uniref:histidine kinase n=1 Tax=Micromonospora echinofusca TaxID=47858 RepID=A0ABS3VJR9_MICEH|nr:nitrate- and nitrite sensing domain-containing protein [Micromonospora echinofusca]MBO4204726.1 HAMP domain-containing protein [Micromonospora echinofusca]
MSTGPTTLPESGLQEEQTRRRWLPRLRDARIRSKLALILVVPVAAVIALAAIRLVAVGQGALDATQVRALTALSLDISALAQDVQKERMAAAQFLAGAQAKPDAYNLVVRRTDEQISEYNKERRALGEVPAAVRDRLRAIDDHLATLNSTRQEVLDREQMPVAEAVLRYGVILTDLVSYGESLAQLPGDDSLADARRSVAAFARAKAATAEEEAVVFAALSSGQLDEEQFSSFVATLTSQQEALLAFSLAADAPQQSLVNRTVTGDAVVLADRVATDVTRSVGQRTPLVTAMDAATAIGAVNDLMRWAEIQLQNQLLADADQARSDVIQQAIVESVLVLLVLVVAIVLAVVLARSLNHSLRRLREGALSVANHDLPDAVARLQNVGSVGDGGVDEIVRQVRDPIKLPNRDEVGQVAQAFNVVHREAVRIAAEQAALRTSVSAMFLNLARRSQTLVDRMIGELDMIERGEEDPKRLAKLFELDHLATRMRRNDENLLVLAGADSAAPRRDDALLIDVLRASQSEVELYNRIEFGTVDTDISVAAHAVNDVVRLVAELLDNATRFSPPTTTVVADARRIRDYVLIQIEDRGLGLTDEQLDSLNRRLAAAATVDVAAFRLMGLAVVSKLAARYNIRVELRRNVEGGTVAQVTLPNATVVLPQPRGLEQPRTRRQPLPVESAPAGPPSPAPAAFGEPMAPVGRTATLPDQWRTETPGPTPSWQERADSRDDAFTVNAGSATAGYPALSGPTGLNPQTGLTNPAALTNFGGPNPSSARNDVRADSGAGLTTPNLFTPVNSQPPGTVPGAPAGPAGLSGPTTPLTTTGGPNPGSSTQAYPAVGSLPKRSPGVATQPLVPYTPPQPPAPHLPQGGGLPAGPVAGMAAASAPGVRRPDEPVEAPIFREMEAVWFRSHGNDSTAIFTMPPIEPEKPPVPPAAQPVAQPVSQPVAGYQSGATVAGAMATPGRPPLPTRSPGESAGTTTPTSSYPGMQVPTQNQPQVAAPAPAPAPVQPAAPPTPEPAPAAAGPTGNEAWRTAADEGWARATRAAEPAVAGTTRSGLPKRQPQAQLVPGGVETKASRDRSRRTPDEVRGLLSAYHRGVQRGRTAGGDLTGRPTGSDPNSTSNKETSR